MTRGLRRIGHLAAHDRGPARERGEGGFIVLEVFLDLAQRIAGRGVVFGTRRQAVARFDDQGLVIVGGGLFARIDKQAQAIGRLGPHLDGVGVKRAGLIQTPGLVPRIGEVDAGFRVVRRLGQQLVVKRLGQVVAMQFVGGERRFFARDPIKRAFRHQFVEYGGCGFAVEAGQVSLEQQAQKGEAVAVGRQSLFGGDGGKSTAAQTRQKFRLQSIDGCGCHTGIEQGVDLVQRFERVGLHQGTGTRQPAFLPLGTELAARGGQGGDPFGHQVSVTTKQTLENTGDAPGQGKGRAHRFPLCPAYAVTAGLGGGGHNRRAQRNL